MKRPASLKMATLLRRAASLQESILVCVWWPRLPARQWLRQFNWVSSTIRIRHLIPAIPIVRPTPSKRRFSPVGKKPEGLFAKLSTARRPKLNNFVGACPLLAQSRHDGLQCTCPLSGVKRTYLLALHMSAFDPKRTSPPSRVLSQTATMPSKI